MSKRWMIGVTLFAAGVVTGSAGTAVLSSRASVLFLQTVRLSFASEEEGKAVGAWKAHDLRAAARHAACGVELESAPSTFEPSGSTWDPTYFLMGLWVNTKTQYPVSNRTQLRALAHARLGRILEESGRSEDAATEYADAGKLGGNVDSQRWRKAAEVTLGVAVQERGQPPPRDNERERLQKP